MRTVIINTCVILYATSSIAVDLKIGGYVDAQLNFNHTKNASGVQNNPSNLQTFRFSEGAVYLEGISNNYKMFLELDLRGPDRTNTNGFSTTTTPTNFSVGAAQSQAYLQASYDNGFSWSFGQKDTSFGYEAADSWEYRYTEAGLLASRMPVTHVGFFPKYELDDMGSVEITFANTYDSGHLKQGNFDYGVKFSFNAESTIFNIGAC